MISRVNNLRKKHGMSPGSLIFAGEQKTEKIKIDIFQYNQSSVVEKKIENVDELSGLVNNQFVLWINISGLHEVEVLGKIGEMFNINSLAIEDILNTGHSPKFEDHENYIFMISKMLEYNPKSRKISIEQISFVLGKNYLITFQEKEGDTFNIIRERLKMNKGRIRKLGADYLMYRLMDSIVDNYTVIILQFDELIEEIEDELLDEPGQETLEEIYRFRKQANKLRRVVIPLKEIIYSIEKEVHPLINKSNHIFIKDLGDHVKSAAESMENYKDQITHMIEIYRSTSGLKLNEILKVLTIISTIFIPLTFLAGLYGMNFNYNASPYNMPEL
ncbi:MAG: magnesium/cobalt transporter CorA, partial [Ignavibacteriales bacterium]